MRYFSVHTNHRLATSFDFVQGLKKESMINRRMIRCVSCGSLAVTRTGIGHGAKQIHKFPCPGCGVEIGFVLNLDQEAVKFDYEDPTNASWDDAAEEAESTPTVLFYPELMIPKGLQYPISPFIATFGEFKDLPAYQQEEALRRHIKEERWPVLMRVYTHFENGNLQLLEKEAATISKNPPNLNDLEERAGWVLGASGHYFGFFVAEPNSDTEIGKQAATAAVKQEPALRAFAGEYVNSGRMLALWKELKSVRKQFMELNESFLPNLSVRRNWKNPESDLAAFELSVKNFEDLKGFYIDCLETTFRFLVIGLGMVKITETGTTTIATAKGDKDIWWFEQMNNGIKNTQLDKYPVFGSVTKYLDTSLRNGVGHHSAHYIVGSDEIAYVKADDAALNEVRLPFTVFVSKVFDTYCAFERAAVFFQFLLLAGGGKLS